MKKARIALLSGDPAGIGPQLCAKLLRKHEAVFSPVIVGNERIHTAALSHIAPDLIDRFPVYDVSAGFLVRGEQSAEGGRMQLLTMGKAAHLLLEARVDAILVIGYDSDSVALYEPSLADDLAFLKKAFPGRDIRRAFYFSGSPMTLYRGLPGPVVFGAVGPRYGEEDTRPEDEKAAEDALSFILTYPKDPSDEL